MTNLLTIPTHVGFILDGNRRWAKEHGAPMLQGHKRGYDTLKTITKAAIGRGVEYVSAYAFSTENWNRTPKEVKYLLDLAYKVLSEDIQDLHKENIRVLWLGSPKRLSPKLLKAIKQAEELTKHNTKGTLCICFNYGGQEEIIDAVQAIAVSNLTSQVIDKKSISANLYKPEVPPVDLIVRTSGEQRLSGFMLWRAAYAELIFVNTYWPDFSESDLDTCLAEYARRQRRFGK